MSGIVDPGSGDINWPEFHRRIARTVESAREALQPSAGHVRSILEERARRLATPMVAGEADVETVEVLGFALGRERYALETRYAREVFRLADFTAIPGAPDFVIGVTNLRGDILPVYDLMLFFGLASRGLMDRSRVIVVGDANTEFGIIADTVQEVMRLSRADFAPDPVFEGKRGRECVRGITRDATIMLDGGALLRDQRLFIGAHSGATS